MNHSRHQLMSRSVLQVVEFEVERERMLMHHEADVQRCQLESEARDSEMAEAAAARGAQAAAEFEAEMQRRQKDHVKLTAFRTAKLQEQEAMVASLQQRSAEAAQVRSSPHLVATKNPSTDVQLEFICSLLLRWCAMSVLQAADAKMRLLLQKVVERRKPNAQRVQYRQQVLLERRQADHERQVLHVQQATEQEQRLARIRSLVRHRATYVPAEHRCNMPAEHCCS